MQTQHAIGELNGFERTMQNLKLHITDLMAFILLSLITGKCYLFIILLIRNVRDSLIVCKDRDLSSHFINQIKKDAFTHFNFSPIRF